MRENPSLFLSHPVETVVGLYAVVRASPLPLNRLLLSPSLSLKANLSIPSAVRLS